MTDDPQLKAALLWLSLPSGDQKVGPSPTETEAGEPATILTKQTMRAKFPINSAKVEGYIALHPELFPSTISLPMDRDWPEQHALVQDPVVDFLKAEFLRHAPDTLPYAEKLDWHRFIGTCAAVVLEARRIALERYCELMSDRMARFAHRFANAPTRSKRNVYALSAFGRRKRIRQDECDTEEYFNIARQCVFAGRHAVNDAASFLTASGPLVVTSLDVEEALRQLNVRVTID